ncbi:c6 zinc finger domain containing protein [Niveomyces insectorum RCEF 264]|uniref:C6 zinc finger domain containing protein n=1 Tax=Niveomyces insectorum RCEF 264 TaxID=1081102 RepID=A0A167S0N7_9HYPO|nr:c6 zinc finger domain containing protein [Niveomyces insectorum RCEF 264]
MPGILPMKVIKVGTSSQSRIAQACDRCRSKKIRCDGIRPCCSQCANVGFECRTSDKLSRRAFPRGYTESLEERVRQLECEVRELKDLLDEKDEKIDMLSKMHNNRRGASVASAAASHSELSPGAASATSASSSPTRTSTSTSSIDNASRLSTSTLASSVSPGPDDALSAGAATTAATTAAAAKCTLPRKPVADTANVKREAKSHTATPASKEDTFRVQASPLVLGVENSDSYFMGASSGHIFKKKMQENGKSCSDFHAEAFLHIQGCYPLVEKVSTSSMRVPPRLFSDRCVNVYFQEWSPLFPVLHRPAFLRIYDEFVSDADKVKNHHKLAQLYLVFAIAALSSDQPDLEQIAACEQQWQRSLDAVLMDNTIITLQCLVLAILYCTTRADYKRLQYYKGIAVGLSHRLGLHQSQKRFSFGALTTETRKKVFWTLYTLDCFSAAILGLPKQLKDADIHAEHPVDADDEYITEKGFQPTLPGESTRLSAALALFRAARILAKVLDTNYPAAATHELSLQQMAGLETELLEWRDSLPAHLTLTFRQEKPSTDVTGNRSPLLPQSLTYYYIRTLIWRPAVGSSLGAKAAPAVMTVSEASKHIIQIVELLEERKMSFSLCLNKPDLLVVCGMSLLYQSMDLKQDSKMMKDTERLVNVAVEIADRTKAPGCYDFKRVAAMLVSIDDVSPPSLLPRSNSESSMAAPARRPSPPSGTQQKRNQQQQQHQQQQQQQHQLILGCHSSTSMSETDLLLQQEKLRRMTLPVTSAATSSATIVDSDNRTRARNSFDNPRDLQQHQQRQQHQQHQQHQQARSHRLSMSQVQMMNRVSQSQFQQPQQQQQQLQQQQQQPSRRVQKKNRDYITMGSNGHVPSQSPQPPSPLQSRLSQHQPHQQFYGGGAPQNQKAQSPSAVSPADWEALLSSMDGGHMNVYDAIYGGPNMGLSSAAAAAAPAAETTPTSATPQSGDGWSPESWDLSGFSLADLTGTNTQGNRPSSIPGPAQSVLSFSDESMSSVAGDDLTSADFVTLGLNSLDMCSLPYRRSSGLLHNGCSAGPDGFVGDNLEHGFAL